MKLCLQKTSENKWDQVAYQQANSSIAELRAPLHSPHCPARPRLSSGPSPLPTRQSRGTNPETRKWSQPLEGPADRSRDHWQSLSRQQTSKDSRRKPTYQRRLKSEYCESKRVSSKVTPWVMCLVWLCWTCPRKSECPFGRWDPEGPLCRFKDEAEKEAPTVGANYFHFWRLPEWFTNYWRDQKKELVQLQILGDNLQPLK